MKFDNIVYYKLLNSDEENLYIESIYQMLHPLVAGELGYT